MINILNNFFKKNYSILTIGIIFLYFFNSILLTRNIYDPHHVNLVFTEASNFLDGKPLYKDIFVKYGVLSTIINSIGLFLFGNNIFSIFLISNIFYFSSIILVFIIFNQLNINKFNILLLVLIILNIHSSIYMPWSNYIAFLPAVLSFFFLLPNNRNLFLSGLFLSISCLCRETYFISAILIFFFILFFFFNSEKKKILFYAIGFLLPILIFFLYLILSKNYLIWANLVLPTYKIDLDLQINFENKNFLWINNYYLRSFLLVIAKTLLDIRDHFALWFFVFYLIFFSSFCVLFYEIFKIKQISFKSIIAIYSLSFVIQGAHIIESFRFITGSIIGIILLDYYLNNCVKKKSVSKIYLTLLVALIICNWSFYFYSISNYLSLITKSTTQDFKHVDEFRNMNYSKGVHNKYLKIIKYCDNLRTSSGIKYSINYTADSSISYFCKTSPVNYYPWNRDVLDKIYFKFAASKSYSSITDKNTIIFMPIKNKSQMVNYKLLYVIPSENSEIYDDIAIVQKYN